MKSSGPPKIIVLDHDDYYARYVGIAGDGRQFFLTTPFVADLSRPGERGREFLALYLFDTNGQLSEARIEDLGPRATLDIPRATAIRDEMLKSLGKLKYKRIKVAPFQVEKFGVVFGLIPRPPEVDLEPDDDWSVIVEPGNYMAFSAPWTSGEYDT